MADRRAADLWAVGALGTLALIPLWRTLLFLAPRCPLHTLTGLPCPSCGTTRAATAFVQGDLLAAAGFNPLATLAAIVLLALGLLAPLWVRLGGPIPRLAGPLPIAAKLAVALALLGNWVYLLLAGL